MSSSSPPTPNIKTRILIISDTHGLTPSPPTERVLQHDNADILAFVSAFRHPLPSADVAIHCGDLTKGSGPGEYSATLSLLASLDAPLKIAIPGNHDMALDPGYWVGRYLRWEPEGELKDRRKAIPAVVRGMIADAREAGVRVLVEEGTYDFVLGNGARLKVFASPWTPAYGGWPFQYRGRHEFAVEEGTDVVVTHGPPRGVLDRTLRGDRAGCRDLLWAVARARPRVHCFGHIHEGWGAKLQRWKVEGELVAMDEEKSVLLDDLETVEGTGTDSFQVWTEKLARRNEWAEKRARIVDMCPTGDSQVSGEDKSRLPRPFEAGKDTLFVNSAIVDVSYRPMHMPWLVDLELPQATEDDASRASETVAVMEQAAKDADAVAASVGGSPAPVDRWT
ncbi:Metallo-dependent phosphatase [Coniochaeta ligniaria NRRL 30616]|uniref:Metallo-dependent phosphatase n=1 Tax=Coniochaeta ligniaria NRRL 30616 TaxID=1408157 RepID=A0A1J7JMX9_9PEZI|nr:Metallo-dependent phosphatase [Coniochaeta ligniaria NRRL 30616]